MILSFRNNYLVEQMIQYGKTIKISHTVFALPFALAAAMLAHRYYPIASFADILWILTAMVAARSAAMGFNRLVDAGYDAKNPRTLNREIPSGALSKVSAMILVIAFSLLFIVAAANLGGLCLSLAIPVLALLFAYSYTKRFTWLCHLYLGGVISLAPLGAWIALTKNFDWPVLLLSFALMTYIAGFDILYACQDTEFDESEGLFSMPVHFGVNRALRISSALHVLSFLFFISIYFAFDMNIIYLASAVIIGMLFIIEHKLVDPNNLKHVHIAFFHMNSVISIVLFCGVLGNELVRGVL